VKRITEAQIKIEIGDWLEKWGCHIYDETPNDDRPHWATFGVKNIERGKKPEEPDPNSKC